MTDQFPPDMIVEAVDNQVVVTCISCDGLHQSWESMVSIESLNESIAAHVNFHLIRSLRQGYGDD